MARERPKRADKLPRLRSLNRHCREIMAERQVAGELFFCSSLLDHEHSGQKLTCERPGKSILAPKT